ncbi:MAG: N-acetylmuramoyl-L-alanine amidase [Victivallaceae bacterium]|nr:N-acetylmuramoyl-L-alanine amidase [Victivallaceae bacterium]
MLNPAVTKYFIGVTMLWIGLAESSVVRGANVRYVQLYGQQYVYLRDVAAYYGMQYAVKDKEIILFSKYSRLVFTVDKKYCTVNGTKVTLLFPAVKYNWRRCISSMDFLKTVDPILRHWALWKHRLARIMLDPGHGGHDKGASGKRFHEKTITLALARKVANLLIRAGYEVSLTRNSDRFIDLRQRADAARQIKADIFISIHANKADNSSVTGSESFCMTPAGANSTYSRQASGKIFPGNRYDVNNTALAYWIQRSLTAAAQNSDRGLKHARFMVLKEAPCPAALIEVGFLSNPGEEKQLGEEAYQWEIARGIAEGIQRYHYQLKRRE